MPPSSAGRRPSLGAGRNRVDAAVDPAVGIVALAKPGERVSRGDGVLELHYRERAKLEGALGLATRAVRIDAAAPPPPPPLIVGRGALMLGVVQPFVGAFVILAIAVALSDEPPRDRLDDGRVGPRAAGRLRAHRAEDGGRPAACSRRSAAASTGCSGLRGVGAAFVFGPLGDSGVWGRAMTSVLGPEGAQYAVIFAFQVLPTIIFIAALFAILYYFGVMQVVVRMFAVVMHRVMKASGAESLNVAASIFMGQTEAPLTIRPYLPEMTESELMTVMTSGMAHISGGIMAAYILFGIEAQHLLTAVIMTAPGTIMMAKMFVPETEVPEDDGDGAARGGADRRQRHRRRRPRHRRRAAPRAERRRDADLVPRAHRAGQRDPRPGAPQPAADLRMGVRAGCLDAWACPGATRRRSATCSARGWR